jgi:hypothetical protein
MRAIAAALIAGAVLTSAPAAQTKPAKTFDIYLSDTEGGKATLFVSPSGESVLRAIPTPATPIASWRCWPRPASKRSIT